MRQTVGLVEIVLLPAMIGLTLVAFWRVRPLAGVFAALPHVRGAYATALTFARRLPYSGNCPPAIAEAQLERGEGLDHATAKKAVLKRLAE